jgi:branched-chain amino acid transport system substrate-binding protein
MGKLMVLLALSLVMVLVVACGGDGTATPTTAPVSQEATTAAPPKESTTVAGEKREVHFFQVNALTGQSASPGTHAVHGIELAAKHVNDEGGFKDNCGNNYTVKLTVHDMANAREQAIAGLRKAADDPSVLVSLGSTPSTGFVPMVPVSGQVKLAIMGTGTAAPISEWNPYAFRVTVTTKAAVPQFMATMVERFDSFKKVALIYDITQDANRAEAELIRDLAGEIGYEIVAFEAFRGGDKDFRAQLTAIRGTDPGWVGIYGAAPEGTAIINQMSEMGFLEEVEFFTGFGSFNGANWWDLTDGKVKGGVNWAVGFDLGSEDSLMKQVVADYGTNFEEDIDIYSVYGYQAFQAAVDAVKRACTATDREAFRDALATTNIQALGGNVILDSPRDNPLGENRSGAIIVNRTTGREATEFEVIPLAK